MTLISVIIPTYKPGAYIYECLDSIINQTLDCKLYEILIILNGFSEPYYKCIASYTDYNNVKILYESMASVSNARNKGLEVAKGEYICFIDDDDVVYSNYLEE